MDQAADAGNQWVAVLLFMAWWALRSGKDRRDRRVWTFSRDVSQGRQQWRLVATDEDAARAAIS